jgi:hypothetical protein
MHTTKKNKRLLRRTTAQKGGDRVTRRSDAATSIRGIGSIYQRETVAFVNQTTTQSPTVQEAQAAGRAAAIALINSQTAATLNSIVSTSFSSLDPSDPVVLAGIPTTTLPTTTVATTTIAPTATVPTTTCAPTATSCGLIINPVPTPTSLASSSVSPSIPFNLQLSTAAYAILYPNATTTILSSTSTSPTTTFTTTTGDTTTSTATTSPLVSDPAFSLYAKLINNQSSATLLMLFNNAIAGDIFSSAIFAYITQMATINSDAAAALAATVPTTTLAPTTTMPLEGGSRKKTLKKRRTRGGSHNMTEEEAAMLQKKANAAVKRAAELRKEAKEAAAEAEKALRYAHAHLSHAPAAGGSFF